MLKIIKENEEEAYKMYDDKLFNKKKIEIKYLFDKI